MSTTNRSRKKVMFIFGTRPEAIKMVPVIKEIERRKDEFQGIVTVTAQHREMLDQVLDIFAIKPDYDLSIMQANQTLTAITVEALQGLEKVLAKEKPDIVLVHGDTTTTFVAALAAFYQQIPIGHVEAGLRTWNKYSPYPEEMNRQLTGVLADLHFAPTERAKNHLLSENVPAERIHITGNTVIDTLQLTVKADYSHPLLEKVGDQRLILVTAHRRENLGTIMAQMFQAIRRLVDKHTDIHVIYPVHLNPVVKQTAEQFLGQHERIQLIEPLGVIDFHNFMARSHLILTDSGGIQEEAPSLGVPVLVLRDTTERPEGIAAGTLKLAGTSAESIFHLTDELLTNETVYKQMAQAKNPYGDGKASQRIVDALSAFFQNQ